MRKRHPNDRSSAAHSEVVLVGNIIPTIFCLLRKLSNALWRQVLFDIKMTILR